MSLLILTASLATLAGLYLAWCHLRGTSHPMLSVGHGFVGFFALAVLIVLLRDLPEGMALTPSHAGSAAAALMTLSLFSGLIGPLYRESNRRARDAVLVAHILAGIAGVVALVVLVVG